MIEISESRELSLEDEAVIAFWPSILPEHQRQLVLVGRLQRALRNRGHDILVDGVWKPQVNVALVHESFSFGPELSTIIHRLRREAP